MCIIATIGEQSLEVEVVESTEGATCHTADEDVQLFALVLINCAIELSGDEIGRHPKLLRMVQDDLFHHLIHYGTCSSPLVLSMICSTVLNIYHFLRRFIRLQLEAFFSFVLLKIAAPGGSLQLQEVAFEAIVKKFRQPTFVIEAYVNYDCDPICWNIFEDVGKLLCKQAFPGSGPIEGLIIMIQTISTNIDKDDDLTPSDPYPVEITQYRPSWVEQPKDNLETWVEYIRIRKAQKGKILIAGSHFNRDEKKRLEYLKHCKLISDPPNPKAYAYFFRYTPLLDKSVIGDYLGDPDEFNLQVLKEFTLTFEFNCMILDSAFRTYLETFRSHGESQKIQRILEAFSERFFDQQSSEIFVAKDSVFILCYSLIMLNTDQHNPQVKKKMTEEEFIRNNSAINGGQDLPREYLSELFHSISNNAITLFDQAGPVDMNPSRWIELMNRTKLTQTYILCDFDRRLGRDMFVSVAGPTIAALSAFFEHGDEDEMLHECIEEETLFAFSNDMKPRMATLSVFTIANHFEKSLKGGLRNIVDCLLKLKRLRLLPQSVIEFDITFSSSSDSLDGLKSESGVILPSHDTKFAKRETTSGVVTRFSHFLDCMEESISLGMSEFEQNMKIIKQCQIESIFGNSSHLPPEALLNLARSLIFAAAGKGQKFSTPIEEEETIGFCWDLIIAISLANINRLPAFWASYQDYLLVVAQFPLFSPIPFAEKAIMGLFKVCLKLLASYQADKTPEELIFKSINLMWKLDKEILDTCCEFIIQSVSKIIIEYPANMQTQLGWKSVLHLLSATGRHPETYDQAVEALIMLMSDACHISKINYAYCIDCAFGSVALKNIPLEKNLKILDLVAESVKLLIHWYTTASSWDQPSNYSISSTSSSDDNPKSIESVNFIMNLFVKLGEAIRKTSLARREEIRNHAILSLGRGFKLAEYLELSSTRCINCSNLVIFTMVDDQHVKMIEYSRRENAERETRSMEGTLKLSMELLTDVYLQYLHQIVGNPGFRTFWLGVLRRMDTCMKADMGEYGETRLKEVVPELLRKMINKMQEIGILVRKEDDDLWDITYIQIQWIAPALKDELFPDET
ncbi:ARF guanine-nucleotide exchange factor GNL2 [Hibiscus syriacus]|uniref:ARF guanine-nucleotide exchange factor GNL2 n=1 Tax=Hibiscus syriacus TaxID=106335 RepID=A0A6A3ATQ5_HIBSY|nr:ARF guanine-nucleotide exchange factor GNL2 [Hibiscus syriacus]